MSAPISGAWPVAGAALLGDSGLHVSLEETGFAADAQGRVTTLLPDWSVQKIKHMGALAAKILLYYLPNVVKNLARQREVTVAWPTMCFSGLRCVLLDRPFGACVALGNKLSFSLR